jgi:hypothetical protein
MQSGSGFCDNIWPRPPASPSRGSLHASTEGETSDSHRLVCQALENSGGPTTPQPSRPSVIIRSCLAAPI